MFDENEYQDLELETIPKVRRGETIKVAKGEGGAGVHVDDVAQAFLASTLNRKCLGQVVNISNPEAYMSDLDVCRLVVE